MAALFISHAAADKPVVDELFDLLQTGCSLGHAAIACTSVEGAGIDTGTDFIEWIERNLADAQLVVLVLSPNYYASKFCIAELGAAWALKHNIFPLMLPTVARDPGVVFLGRQSARLDPTGLDELRDRILELFDQASRSTSRWVLKRSAFFERVEVLLDKLPKPAVVERDQLEQAEESTREAMRLYKEAVAEVRALRDHIQRLEKAKDAAEVQQIRAQLTPAVDRFEALRKTLRSELHDLERVEVRAIFETLSGSEWFPASDTWEMYQSSLERAAKSKWLIEHEHMGEAVSFTANEEHPRLEPIFEMLKELREILAELPTSVRKALEAEAGCLFDLSNWQFWEDQLLYSSLVE